jgi:hypothetical protein
MINASCWRIQVITNKQQVISLESTHMVIVVRNFRRG